MHFFSRSHKWLLPFKIAFYIKRERERIAEQIGYTVKLSTKSAKSLLNLFFSMAIKPRVDWNAIMQDLIFPVKFVAMPRWSLPIPTP